MAAAVGLSCLAAYKLGLTLGPPAAPSPPAEYEIEGLVVAAGALELGEVWESKVLEHQLPIRNRTGGSLQVRDLAVSCGCLSIEPRKFTIPPYGTTSVQLKIDLTWRERADIGLPARPFTLEITPLTKNGWPRKGGWKLQGVVKSRVTLDALSLHFGQEGVYGQTSAPRKVVATAHVPAQLLDVVTDPNQYEVLVALQPELPPGPFASEINIDLITAAGERVFAAKLPIDGQVQPAVRPLPAHILLGSKPLDATAEAVVVLQVPPRCPIQVDRIETESEDVQVAATDIQGIPFGRAFRITQRITRVGDQRSTVRFVCRHPGQPPMSISTVVSYRGEADANVDSADPVKRGTNP